MSWSTKKPTPTSGRKQNWKKVVTSSEYTSKAAKHVEAFMKAAFEVELPNEHAGKSDFRVSMQPRCCLLSYMGVGKQGDTPYSMEFYTSIGTAIHELLQKALPLSSQKMVVWGDWECTKCKKKWAHCFLPACCGRVEYREVSLEYKGLTGHIDLITCTSDKEWLIHDWKSCGIKYVEKKDYREKYLPFKKNVFQIEIYCILVERLFGFRPSAYSLIYQSRDNPEKYVIKDQEWTPELQEKRTKWLKRLLSGRKAELAAQADPSSKNLLELIAKRPCRTKADYNEYMKEKFTFETTTGCNCPFFSGHECMVDIKTIQNPTNPKNFIKTKQL